MAALHEDDPEIGSLNAHLSGEPAQAIVMTPGQAGIEVKNNVLAVMPHFYGRKIDNPYEFLHEFCKLCGIQRRPAGSSEEEYRLCAIPFALKGEADTWFMRLPPNSIRSWAEFRSIFLDYFFPATRTNALKKEIQGATQEGDETLSQYWGRFKGLLDTCPNNRMSEAEIYNNFYEGLAPESKDLVNSSSGGDFSRVRLSEARKVMGRLIDAKKAYDNPRAQVLRRAPVHAATDQADDKMEARMDRFEKAILNALEKNKPPPAEKCKAPLGQKEAYSQYGQASEMMDYQQVNAVGNWNPGGHWNQNGGCVPRQRDAPWREHPNFRWTEPNSVPPPQPSNAQAQEERSQWPSRNSEGQTAGIEARATSPTGRAEMRRTSMFPLISEGNREVKVKARVGITTRVQEGTSTIPKEVEITTISKDHLEIPSTPKGPVLISKEDQTSNIQGSRTGLLTIW
ncbi:hypothetical protein AAHA92_21476 [Salvia divinorum]|uniref:Retrotransposon gag domain-containing protein n=1 Tax=Salvia divinorum TaxID=28513 RepID=A0ABD1GKK2_SALDI